MKLLYGTGNQAKLSLMKNRLCDLDVQVIGLNDLKDAGIAIPEVLEDGDTPLENARKKASAYYKAFQIPVFSCDSGLYFENVPENLQPGIHVRNVNGKRLNDIEMVEYYSQLAKTYGNLIAKYKNAIYLILDEEHTYECMDETMESEKFLISDTPRSSIRKEGFPLDSLSIDMKTQKYYYDLPDCELERDAVKNGLISFFQMVLNDQ